jgi:hypothetical protein
MTKYRWKIVYKDGTQCTADNTGYGAILRENVISVSIIDDRGAEKYSVPLEENENFAYRRRVKQTPGSAPEVCHILMKFTEKGNKFAFIFEDGSPTHTRDNFQKNHKWFYPPIISDFETI